MDIINDDNNKTMKTKEVNKINKNFKICERTKPNNKQLSKQARPKQIITYKTT